MTQHDRILKYMNDFGSITPIEAFSDLGITKLATRISELQKDGYKFNKETVKARNRYGGRTHFMRYSLEVNDGEIH